MMTRDVEAACRDVIKAMGGDAASISSYLPSIKASISSGSNKVDAVKVRFARKRIARYAVDTNQLNEALDKIDRIPHGPVDCDQFVYCLAQILEDRAVRDLVSSPALDASTLSTSMNTTALFASLPLANLPPEPPTASDPAAQSAPIMRPMPSISFKALDPIETHPVSQRPSSASQRSIPLTAVTAPNLVMISFGDQIALRSHFGLYVLKALFQSSGEAQHFSASWPTPFGMTLISASSRRDRGPITFGDSVLLVSGVGPGRVCIAADTTGTLSVVKPSSDSRVKWSIIPANNLGHILNDLSDKMRSPVRISDRLLLKSCFGTLLCVEEGNSVRASGSELSPNCVWGIYKASIPYTPSWYSVTTPIIPVSASRSMKAMTSKQQETILCRAVLSALFGVSSDWIYVTAPGTFRLTATNVCVTMVFQVERCLSACNQHLQIQQFIKRRSQYEYGLINQALSGSMESVVETYLVGLVQLEGAASSSLQRLWFHLQSSLHTLSCLARLIQNIPERVTGGALIQVVFNQYTNEGDNIGRALYLSLLNDCSRPYFAMLDQWIHSGRIVDPYDEFQIRSRDDLTKDDLEQNFNDAYWDDRYTARAEHCPSFLAPFSQRVLLTGKYLNVLLQCNRTTTPPVSSTSQSFGFDATLNGNIIEEAFVFASRELLDVLLREGQLLSHLRCLKRYFLHEQGDFFVHFLDSAGADLAKPVDTVVLSHLQAVLDLSLSTAGDDFGHEDISCRLESHALIDKLNCIHSMTSESFPRGSRTPSDRSRSSSMRAAFTGLEAFTLAYTVRWPLSIVLSKKALTKYQLLFRHLFYIKHVERQISTTWKHQQRTRELDLSSTFSRSYALRQRMLHFLQNLVFYLTIEVLEPNWRRLEVILTSQVTTVDQVLEAHDAFLDLCLKECLLTNHNLLQSLNSILSSCLIFASNINNFHRVFDVQSLGRHQVDQGAVTGARRRQRLALLSNQALAAGKDRAYSEMIDRFLGGFDGKLVEFIRQLSEKATGQYDSHMGNLCTRLDYNNYYRPVAPHSDPR